jgi:Chondroitinase B
MPVLFCGRNGWMLPLLLATLVACIAPANAATSPKPDVVPTSLSLGSGTLASGGTTPLKLAVTNQGTSTAYSVTVTVSMITGGTVSRVARVSLGTLRPGASGTIVTTLTAPAQAGSYDVVATATAWRWGGATNNSLTTTLQVTDLSVVASTSPATPTSATSSARTTSKVSATSRTSSPAVSFSTSTAPSSVTSSSSATPSTSSATTSSPGTTTSSSDSTTSSFDSTTSSSGATTSSSGATIAFSSGATTSDPTAAASTPCDYYASPNGGGDGLTSSRPFRIQDFWAKAAPGKTLCLLDGIYQGAANMIVLPVAKSGTSTAPITIRALNDGAVFIDGQFARVPVRVEGNSYFTFEGFDAGNSSNTVISINGAGGSSTGLTFKRICASNAKLVQPSLNVHVWGLDNMDNSLFEDICGFGTGRNTLVSGGNTPSNTFRRVWIRWEGHCPDSGGTSGGWPVQLSYRFSGGGGSVFENFIVVYDPEQYTPCATYTSGNRQGGLAHRGPSQGTGDKLSGWINYGYDGFTVANRTAVDFVWIRDSANAFDDPFKPSLRQYKDFYVDTRSQTTNAFAAQPFSLVYCPGGGICSLNAADRLTSVKLSTAPASEFFITPTNQNECNAENTLGSPTPGNCPNFYTGDTNGGAPFGSRACFQYNNGTLGTTPLWPWPMDNRIKAALARANAAGTGGSPLAGTSGTGYAAGTVTSEIVSRYGIIPTQCRR